MDILTDPEQPHGSSAAGLRQMWQRQAVAWHIILAGMLVISAVVVVAGDVANPLWQLACLAGIATAYAVWGPTALARGEREATRYLAVAWVLLVAANLFDAGTPVGLMLFVLFPQTWAMASRRVAIGVTVAGVAVLGTIRWVTSDKSDSATSAIVIASFVSLAVSLVLGLFIDRIITEATERAATIDELRATQARLAAVERERGVATERERLSREIHDTLAQGFTSVLALARAADSALARGDIDTARERLELVELTASDNLREARVIVAELTPGHLQSRTLAEALGRLVEGLHRQGGVEVRLDVDGEPVPLGGNAEVVMLRTAQEALANVRRHSGAAHARLHLSYAAPDAVVLEVTDDGHGFDPGDSASGFGLDGIVARAREVGGVAQVTSSAGRGTRVRLEIPRAEELRKVALGGREAVDGPIQDPVVNDRSAVGPDVSGTEPVADPSDSAGVEVPP